MSQVAESTQLTIAEELFLLNLEDPDEVKGLGEVRRAIRQRVRGSRVETPWFGAALVFELTAMGCIDEQDLDPSAAEELGTEAELYSQFVPVAGATASEPLLAEALQMLRDTEGAQAATACAWTLNDDAREPDVVRDRLIARLEQRGLVERRRQEGFSSLREADCAASSPGLRAGLRARIEAVLLGGLQPDPRETAFVCLTRCTGVPDYLMPRQRKTMARAKEIFADALDRRLPGASYLGAIVNESARPGSRNDDDDWANSMWNEMSLTNHLLDLS